MLIFIKFCPFRSITLLIGQLLMIYAAYLRDAEKLVTFTYPETDTPVKVAALHLFGKFEKNIYSSFCQAFIFGFFFKKKKTCILSLEWLQLYKCILC